MHFQPCVRRLLVLETPRSAFHSILDQVRPDKLDRPCIVITIGPVVIRGGEAMLLAGHFPCAAVTVPFSFHGHLQFKKEKRELGAMEGPIVARKVFDANQQATDTNFVESGWNMAARIAGVRSRKQVRGGRHRQSL
jgi:hypothetical protein